MQKLYRNIQRYIKPHKIDSKTCKIIKNIRKVLNFIKTKHATTYKNIQNDTKTYKNLLKNTYRTLLCFVYFLDTCWLSLRLLPEQQRSCCLRQPAQLLPEAEAGGACCLRQQAAGCCRRQQPVVESVYKCITFAYVFNDFRITACFCVFLYVFNDFYMCLHVFCLSVVCFCIFLHIFISLCIFSIFLYVFNMF